MFLDCTSVADRIELPRHHYRNEFLLFGHEFSGALYCSSNTSAVSQAVVTTEI
jgi:hypothetical protein